MKNYNVIILSLDGYRRDKLNLTGEVSKILKKGYYFSNMITASPYTFASMFAMWSSLYPTKNGVNSYYNMFRFKKDTCKTLTEYFHDSGYFTLADMSINCMLPKQGFDRFEVYDRKKDNVVERQKNFISEAAKKNKFFIFLHISDINPVIIKEVADRYDDFADEIFNNPDKIKKLYNDSLKVSEDHFKQVFDHIEKLGLLKNTIVLILSDHGTSNAEKRGEKMYGVFVYDYTLRVFCSFLCPDIKPKQIDFQVNTLDIMPTILELVDIKIDDSFEPLQGKSLMSYIRGEEKENRVVFSETGGLGGPWPSHKEHNVFCIREDDYKLIYNKTPDTWELYNLKEDPEEKNNIIKQESNRAEDIKKKLFDQLRINLEEF